MESTAKEIISKFNLEELFPKDNCPKCNKDKNSWNEEKSEWNREDSTEVAVKIFKTAINLSSEFLREVKINLEFRFSGFVTRIYGLTRHPDTGSYAIVLQFQQYGDLKKYFLKKIENLNWFELNNILKDICDGLSVIHKENYCHMDFHTGNILFGIDGVRLSDFGHSRPVNESPMVDKRPTIPLYTPDCYVTLMRQCWQPVPENRPKAEELFFMFAGWCNVLLSASIVNKNKYAEALGFKKELEIEWIRRLYNLKESPQMSSQLHFIYRKSKSHSSEKDESGVKEKWFEAQVKNLEIPYKEFKISSEPLGGSGCGELRLATWENCKDQVVIKKVQRDAEDSEECRKHFIYELYLHDLVKTADNVIKVFGFTKEKDEYEKESHLIVMEFANCGSLENYIEDPIIFNRLSWLDKIQLTLGIAEGLKCLHDKNIIHRDLHPGNVLIHDGTPKIADFGAGKQMGLTTSHRNGKMGAVCFREPKCHGCDDKPKYQMQKSSDIYSLGVIIWQISSGRAPFETIKDKIPKEELSERIAVGGEREKKVEGTPDRYVYLYEDCWKLEPENRPNIAQYIPVLIPTLHEFLSELDRVHNGNGAYLMLEEKFTQEEITVSMIKQLTDVDLEKLGVNKMGWRKNIQHAASKY
ncbi:24186_t:CDS:10 [Dentiscutata erythropus]|uniref:24186_t:CDS:1 n=1 Tax=Dentiscutata erythropus TaxID=1348616 RepID=A0A9N9B5A3_9GLOM|nr:24186_t:CDS:10 [Dentiscutata erythropus]